MHRELQYVGYFKGRHKDLIIFYMNLLSRFIETSYTALPLHDYYNA